MRTRLAFLILVFLSLWTGISSGSTEDAAPVSFPLWWTLTDEISPEELRAMHRDVELSQRRYMEAAEAGYATSLPESSLKSIRLFYSGALTPELVPMWQAFHAFAVPLRGRTGPRSQAKALQDLATFGIPIETAKSIIDSGLRFLDEVDGQQLELRDQQTSLTEILYEASFRLDPEIYRKAVDSRDAALLARSTGRDPELVAKLLRIWERDPVAERAAVSLLRLNSELSPADWERFRMFLLMESAAGTSVIDYSDNAIKPKETNP